VKLGTHAQRLGRGLRSPRRRLIRTHPRRPTRPSTSRQERGWSNAYIDPTTVPDQFDDVRKLAREGHTVKAIIALRMKTDKRERADDPSQAW